MGFDIAINVLAAVGALAVGILLYRWATTDSSVGLEPARLAQLDTDEEGDLLDQLAAHLDSAVVHGGRVDLLRNGIEIFPAMLEAIDAAEDTVHFLTYVYWTGAIAEEMASRLAAAAARGVTVRVLLDGYGAAPMNRRLVDELREAGAHVAWFHPLRWFHFRHLNNRTHRKVLVVDGRVSFTGGVGIAEEWEGDARNEDEWRDSHFKIQGPATNHLQGAFADNWRDATGEVLVGARLFPEIPKCGGSRIMPLVTSPAGQLSPIAFLYWMVVTRAEDSVDIATPYFLPDDGLVRAIRRTAERGVRVRITVPGDHNDSGLLRAASLTYYPDLLESGVEVHEFETSMFHAKTLVVDDRLAIIGSSNFDDRSFRKNDEVTLVVDDPDLTRRLRRSFEEDLRSSRRIEMDDITSRSLRGRLASRAAILLRRQL